MNTNIVLKKIMALLSSDDKEVALTYARLTDGTILESPTFDVGEPVEVVSEDGTKTPAPDGEHELALKDSEGNETRLKIITKDGVITERENVELEMVDVEPIPQAGEKNKANEVPTAAGSVTSGTQKMAEELPSGDGVEEEVEPLPEDTDAPEVELGKMVEKLAYRIDELEKKIAKMEEIKEDIEEEMEEEEELPKLDGAPTEPIAFTKLSQVKKTDKVANTQSRFLQNLYK